VSRGLSEALARLLSIDRRARDWERLVGWAGVGFPDLNPLPSLIVQQVSCGLDMCLSWGL
jgi:hypothetical protein